MNDKRVGLMIEPKVLKLLKRKYSNIEQNKNIYGFYDFIDKENKILFELKTLNPKYYEIKKVRQGTDKVEKYFKQYKQQGYKMIYLYYIKQNIYTHTIKGFSITEFMKRYEIIEEWKRKKRTGIKDKVKPHFFIYITDFNKFKYQYKFNHELENKINEYFGNLPTGICLIEY